MKSDDFQRSVRSSRNERSEGDAPNIGKVGRMPGTGLPKGERRKRYKHEGGNGGSEKSNRAKEWRRKVVLMWSLMLAGVVLLILGISVWMWIRPNMETQRGMATSRSLPSEEELFIKPVIPSLSEEDSIALVERALAVRESEKVGDYFRIGSATPVQIVDFLKSLEAVDGAVSRVAAVGSVDANGMTIDGVVVNFKGSGQPRNRVAMLTPDETGKWKVDYDAFARTATPSWSEFLEKRAPSAQVRVYGAVDYYFNGVFRDEAQWICYGLASPDVPDVLYGYCKKGSPQADAMAAIFKKNPVLNRATLVIRREEGADPRQVVISQVLAEDWVVGAKPFEDRFK